jgi:formylglycine-generating enzyme required for sulfatase activity
MKTSKLTVVVLVSLLISLYTAQAQAPVISSFSQNGVLVCTNLQPGTVASVEWASSLSGPWQTNWAGLDAVTVNSNATISISVPMFYRVRGVAYIPPSTADGMVLVPAGSFTMGNLLLDGNAVTNDPDIADADPTNVYVSAFYMDTNLVSYSQWQTVYNWATSHGYGFDNTGAGKAANHPVQTVDWWDTVKWCNARSQQAGLTPVYYADVGLTQVYTNGDADAVCPNWAAKGYRLPTEAEWEKAARGGLSGQRFPWGNTISENQANYHGDTNDYSYDLGPNGYNPAFTNGATPYTSPVGSFAANGYGLYDMAGNVFEWCWDWYGTPYAGGSDPRGPVTGTYRMMRGGFWDGDAPLARCANHDSHNWPELADYHIGFRCVRGL